MRSPAVDAVLSSSLFITLFFGIQIFFVCLDLVDRYLDPLAGTGDRAGAVPQPPPEPLRFETLAFMATVLVIYLAIQLFGFALVPHPTAVSDRLQHACAHWFSRQAVGEATGWRLVLLTFFAFHAGGLWDYLIHRFISHGRLFWFTHEYHHLPTQVFVLMPGLASRPFAVVSTFPVTVATLFSTYGLLVLFGLPLWSLASLKVLWLLQLFVLTSSHSSCLRRWWGVHRVMKLLGMTTPQEHLLHHAADLKGNYGNFTSFWDHVFGTYLDPQAARNQGHPLGLAYDQDFLGTLTMGRIKMSKSLRKRFQVDQFCRLG